MYQMCIIHTCVSLDFHLPQEGQHAPVGCTVLWQESSGHVALRLLQMASNIYKQSEQEHNSLVVVYYSMHQMPYVDA